MNGIVIGKRMINLVPRREKNRLEGDRRTADLLSQLAEEVISGCRLVRFSVVGVRMGVGLVFRLKEIMMK